MIKINVNGKYHNFKTDAAANRFIDKIKKEYLSNPYFTRYAEIKERVKNLQVKNIMSHADISTFDKDFDYLLNWQMDQDNFKKPAPLTVFISRS